MNQPTIDDVAAAAGVSAATVSRALRGLDKVHPDTRERVRAAAERLNYIASPTASGLASGRTRLVGVVTPFVGRWFFTSTISAIDKALRDHHHHMLLMDLEQPASPDERLSLTQSLMFKRVDGLVLINVDLRGEERELVERLRLPVVTIGNRFADAPWVGIDDVESSRLVTDHLLDLGHTRICFVGAARATTAHRKTPNDRVAGFRQAMAARGTPVREDWVRKCDWSAADAYALVRSLLQAKDRPSAILAASDEMALGAYGAALELGLRVPADLSIVGIDDHDLAVPFRLTTVRQDVAAQGTAAARTLLGELAVIPRRQDHDHLFPCELVVRASTAPPSA
ncbi:MAG: LacI family DNA-binding transcriptional regulator [Dermatophilaceae bacterium]